MEGRGTGYSEKEAEKSHLQGEDNPDALPKKYTFTIIDKLAIIVSIGSFVFDTGTDVIVAYRYFITKQLWYFWLTIAFIAFPALTMTGFSLRWYIQDRDTREEPPASKWKWFIRVLFLLFQLGPVLRYIDSLLYGCKAERCIKDKQKYYQLMVYEDTDATMLRLFECFMEAAPQLVLQLYVMVVHASVNKDDVITVMSQIASVLTSLVSVSWAMVSYHRSLRYSLPDKQNMTIIGTTFQFLWQLFMVAARVLALALFASRYPHWIFPVCLVHWILMTVWVITQKTRFCETKCEEMLFNGVVGVIYVFCFFNVKDEQTRYKYFVYYTFTFGENVTLVMLWFLNCSPSLWFRVPAFVGHFCSFFVGLVLMMIYYLYLHPTGSIKIRLRPKREHTSIYENHDGTNHVIGEKYVNGNSNNTVVRLDNYKPRREVLPEHPV